jgi:hypothetical protein
MRHFRNKHPQGESTAFFFGGEYLSFFNKEIGQILGKKKFCEISTKFTIFWVKFHQNFNIKK